MKRWLLSSLLLLLVLVLAACTQGKRADAEQYDVYFATQNKSFPMAALAPETYTKQADEELIPSLLQQLLKGPTQEHLAAIIPEGVLLRDWKLRDGVLSVDFSGVYGKLSGIDLSLADYSVAMTLCQVEGVDGVITMVEGDRVRYRDREILQVDDVSGALHIPAADMAQEEKPAQAENSQ